MFRELFFIIFIINIRTSSCVIEDLYEAGQHVWRLYTIIDNRELDTSHDVEATEHVSDNPIIQELKKQVDKIHEQLNQMNKLMGSKKIRDVVKSWPLNAPIIRDIDGIEIFVQNIDEYYEKFNHYRNESHYSYASFEIFMNGILRTLEGDIGIIRKFLTNKEASLTNEENLIASIAGFVLVHGAEICGTPQVISNILIQLFRMIIIAELKTSTMLAYDNIYGYMRNKDKGEWQSMSLSARKGLEEQFTIYINIFSLHMSFINGVYNRACDPPGGNWTRDESFYELEKTFQSVVFTYDRTKCQTNDCNNVLIENSASCPPSFYARPVLTNSEDTVAQCVYLGSIKACILKSGPYRFQYVNSRKLGFLGRNSSCPKGNGQLVDSSKTPTGLYAACACDSYSSLNLISLGMIKSNVVYNRIITGLRFIRKNRILYIQPREGTLESNGFINRSSQRWIPIPKIKNCSLIEPINKKNRVFFLDDVTLPESHVLTGIQFYKVTRRGAIGYAIRIIGTYFDYKTGILSPETHEMPFWNESDEINGKSLSFTPVSSLFTKLPHTVTPSDTKYVLLKRSSLEEDFGQSTLPLFDAVSITFEVPSALGGVGMFHKGVENYAGLISLRVYGIDYRKYFNDFKVFHIINDRVSFNSSFH